MSCTELLPAAQDGVFYQHEYTTVPPTAWSKKAGPAHIFAFIFETP